MVPAYLSLVITKSMYSLGLGKITQELVVEVGETKTDRIKKASVRSRSSQFFYIRFWDRRGHVSRRRWRTRSTRTCGSEP